MPHVVQQLRPVRHPVEAAPGETVLNVALYPYVPRPDQFESVVAGAWGALYPDVGLNFVDYDCYAKDPDAKVDVFAFDCIYTSYFLSKNFLMKLSSEQLGDVSDFFPWALAACQGGDGSYYAIPYLGCAYCLIYRSGDTALDQALSLSAVYDVIGNAPPDQTPPPANQGLILDLTGATTDSCFYLETYEEIENSYGWDPPLPQPNALDSQVIVDLQTLRNMAGFYGAAYRDPGDARVSWFLQGFGRALVGPTETLAHFLPPSVIEATKLHVLPFDQQRQDQPFYVDALGVNSQIDPSKAQYAVAFANLVAGVQVMVQALVPDPNSTSPTAPNPQYLLPARQSVLAKFASNWDAYEQIQNIVTFHTGSAFRIGSTSRSWLKATKAAICAAIFDGQQLCVPEVPHPALTHLPVHLMRRV